MVMKDIEALMEQAKNGDQSELYYLYDNRLGVFAPDFNDDDKLSDFLKECSDININLAKLSDILEHLAQKGHEWAFAYLHENGVGVFAPDFNDDDKLSDFLEECVEAGLDIQEHIDSDILYKLCRNLTNIKTISPFAFKNVFLNRCTIKLQKYYNKMMKLVDRYIQKVSDLDQYDVNFYLTSN
jgi:hypothetical protein